MEKWNSFKLTKQGLRLQAKAQTGQVLNISKAAAGNGYLPDGADVIDLTDMVSSVDAPVNLTGSSVLDNGIAALNIRVENYDKPFYFRELGIYAIDPDDGEILYGYTNCGDYADFIPAKTAAGAVIEDITLIVQIGNSENLSVNVSLVVEVTKDEFEAEKIRIDTLAEALSNTVQDTFNGTAVFDLPEITYKMNDSFTGFDIVFDGYIKCTMTDFTEFNIKFASDNISNNGLKTEAIGTAGQKKHAYFYLTSSGYIVSFKTINDYFYPESQKFSLRIFDRDMVWDEDYGWCLSPNTTTVPSTTKSVGYTLEVKNLLGNLVNFLFTQNSVGVSANENNAEL